MPDLAAEILAFPHEKTAVFSVGQAGYIVKSRSGQLLGIDLYLSDCVERIEGHAGFKRLLPKLLAPSELALDVLIATHPHADHFDVDAMPALLANGKTRLYASADCAALLAEPKSENVRFAAPHECAKCGDFALRFVSCDHGSSAPDAFGVLITVDGRRILEVGDTCLRLDFTDEYLADGPLDLLIAPINGAYGNLDERACARLCEALRPRLTVPCHYGMFASHNGSPGAFYREMTENHPQLPFRFLAQGEALILDDALGAWNYE